MNIRNRLALISSIVFGVIFSVAAAIIYFFFLQSTQRNIINDLQKTCLISGIYYLEKDEQTLSEHNEVKMQFEELINSSMVAVIDTANKIQFGQLEGDRNITSSVLSKIRQQKRHSFKSENHFYYGMFYKDNQGDFVVIVKENNESFRAQVERLLIILVSVLIIAWISIVILSVALSKIAYRPIKRVIEGVNARTLDNLASPIPYSPTNDELQELIETYNGLLNRVNNVFLAQKNFINYISHEFKTPLTAISVALEVFSQKERSSKEYKEVSRAALNYVYELESILTSMMILAGVNSQTNRKQLVRIDEIIWDLIDKCKKQYNANIAIEIQVNDYKKLEYNGNETQLQIAFYNILENAIKYSKNKPVSILVLEKNHGIHVLIRDQGPGISAADFPHIHQAFYRGKNSEGVVGSGVGLSLAQVIFEQHKILFEISPTKEGTSVSLIF